MSKLMPESLWRVSRKDEAIVVVDPKGVLAEARFDAIYLARVATNVSGPCGADFWWVLENKSNVVVAAFSQGAIGEPEMVDWWMSLSGFDHEMLTLAMRSTRNADFVVWRNG
jgi:hypothetical protein